MAQRVEVYSEDEDYSSPYHSDKRLTVAPMTTLDLLNHILKEVQTIKMCMDSRLTSLELKVSSLVQTCHKMTGDVANVHNIIEKRFKRRKLANSAARKKKPTPSVLVNFEVSEKQPTNRPYSKVFTLPTEKDYPHGSWIGDPDDPTRCVRCSITPEDLLHINSTCGNPIKMALTLVDHLFTKEDLAMSNISGRSNLNKKQLDPVIIFGIECHLKYKFDISTNEWRRIRLNIDSKCRYAYKKMKETNEIKHLKNLPKLNATTSARKEATLNESLTFDFEPLQNNLNLSSVKVIQSPCELRILNSTDDPMNQLPVSQEIILAEEPMLTSSTGGKNMLISDPGVSINTVVLHHDELDSGITIDESNHHTLSIDEENDSSPMTDASIKEEFTE